MVLTIVAAVFVFGMLVLVHELGHFITAKLTGMRVDEFAIGFGPKLFSIHYGETVYSIRCIPLGGFNDIAGMNPEDNTAGIRGYCEKPVLSRMIVILAGSLMNFILPLFLFFSIYFFAGVSTPVSEPVLGRVLPDRPAEMAGLREGDRILQIEDKSIDSWQDFVLTVKNHGGDSMAVRYERDGAEGTTTLTPAYDNFSKRMMVGVMSAVTTTYPGFFASVQMSVVQTLSLLSAMVNELIKLFGQMSGAELAGPIGVAQMAGEVAQFGFVPLLRFAAFLSLNLGLINLFPIPALDGGHFLTLVVEAVRGKPLSPKALHYVQSVGVALLVMLMLYATKNDIVRVFMGG